MTVATQKIRNSTLGLVPHDLSIMSPFLNVLECQIKSLSNPNLGILISLVKKINHTETMTR